MSLDVLVNVAQSQIAFAKPKLRHGKRTFVRVADFHMTKSTEHNITARRVSLVRSHTTLAPWCILGRTMTSYDVHVALCLQYVRGVGALHWSI